MEDNTYEAALQKKKGGEIVKVGMIVGAEEERRKLESLLRRRAQLTGEDTEMKLTNVGFGGKYGLKVDRKANDAIRFEQDKKGLVMKGKKIAEWKV